MDIKSFVPSPSSLRPDFGRGYDDRQRAAGHAMTTIEARQDIDNTKKLPQRKN
jgi:hypothetical protein